MFIYFVVTLNLILVNGVMIIFYILGNFLEACKLMCEHKPEFNQVFNGEINYTSPLLQNELIGMCAENVRNMIVTEIKKAGSYSIMCDEAR